jgi:hypothetical protein
MPVPTTNFKINNITNELGVSYIFLNKIENIFEYGGIKSSGIDNTYCPGSNNNDRLNNLRSLPYEIGKWRNYNHTSDPNPPNPAFNINTDVLVYSPENIFKITPGVSYVPVGLGQLSGSEFGVLNDRASITMSSDKIFRTRYGSEKLEVFNVLYTPNFSATFSGSINLSEPSIGGIDYIGNNQILYGYTLENTPDNYGMYANHRIGYVNITNTPPLPISNGFPIKDSIYQDSIVGDIVWDSVDNRLFTLIYDVSLFDSKWAIRKFSILGDKLDEGRFNYNVGNILFFDSDGKLINIKGMDVYEVNKSTLNRTLIAYTSNISWRGSAQVH